MWGARLVAAPSGKFQVTEFQVAVPPYHPESLFKKKAPHKPPLGIGVVGWSGEGRGRGQGWGGGRTHGTPGHPPRTWRLPHPPTPMKHIFCILHFAFSFLRISFSGKSSGICLISLGMIGSNRIPSSELQSSELRDSRLQGSTSPSSRFRVTKSQLPSSFVPSSGFHCYLFQVPTSNVPDSRFHCSDCESPLFQTPNPASQVPHSKSQDPNPRFRIPGSKSGIPSLEFQVTK